MSSPSPLGLRNQIDGFNMRRHGWMCPPERNALYEFYITGKGNEWTRDSKWGDEFVLHCDWYGITCNNDWKFDVSWYSSLDLNDNDLKGMMTEFIELLRHLKHLRLSYNSLT
jgi:hypothetical protein